MICWKSIARRTRLPLMFTGIVQDIGIVRSVGGGGDLRLGIATGMDLSGTATGASVACSGCCLTVVEKVGDVFFVDVSAETLGKTKIGTWEPGTKVNLEPALRQGDELGGHIVSGHVDGLARIAEIEAEGGSRRFLIEAPPALARFIAPKGSICLDGVSLTVNDVQGRLFGVNIIPHTWAATTLNQRRTGDELHMEIDMLARYVARMMEAPE